MGESVVDYSWSYPGADAIVASGYCGAMRYLGGDGRCITEGERDELLAAGAGIGLIWETEADRTLDGYQAGLADAGEANRWADDLGAPGDVPIYYATDFGASDSQINGPIVDYYIGARDHGGRLVRCYGGAPVIEAVRWAIGTGPGWQAAAASWSDYRLSPDAHMLQAVEQCFGGAADHNDVLCPATDIDWLWGRDMPLSQDDLDKIGALMDQRIAALYTGQRALQAQGDSEVYELVFVGDGNGGAKLVRRYIPSPGEMAVRRYGDHLAEKDWTGDARLITDPDMIEAFHDIPVGDASS